MKNLFVQNSETVRAVDGISHTAPIKEVGLEEAKIDDIIRAVYQRKSGQSD